MRRFAEKLSRDMMAAVLCFFVLKHFRHTEEVDENVCPETVDSVAIGKPERHVRKASHCGSKQQ